MALLGAGTDPGFSQGASKAPDHTLGEWKPLPCPLAGETETTALANPTLTPQAFSGPSPPSLSPSHGRRHRSFSPLPPLNSPAFSRLHYRQQNSRRKGSDFVGEFWKVLPDALRDVMQNGDEFARTSAMRLVGKFYQDNLLYMVVPNSFIPELLRNGYNL
ncbi:hypothetical protein CRG98_035049 [Punica granatum]|uniref:Uncharacterized protein n=1 Tax=Punica granatum TaxID=22663 RepID=A0A2I0IKM6_PUNGR|nr:hypothetical protein CRG98_035049 [Punica granatum]